MAVVVYGRLPVWAIRKIPDRAYSNVGFGLRG